MIPIRKGSENPALTQLRLACEQEGLSPQKSYEQLGNPLKTTVRQQLLKEQGHLCAYCMCQLPREDVPEGVSPMVIEHLYPREAPVIPPKNHGLDYDNLFMVCHGNQGGKGRGRSKLTCDAHKENKLLRKVNPCKPETLETIYYDVNGEIHALDRDVEFDLNNVLNLNAQRSSLLSERKRALWQLTADMANLKVNELKTYCLEHLQLFQKETDPKTPYLGVLIYYLKSLLSGIEGSGAVNRTEHSEGLYNASNPNC